MPFFHKINLEPTVVHRSTPKDRRPHIMSLDKGVLGISPEISPTVSPSNSGENSSNSTAPLMAHELTGATSLESKPSYKSQMSTHTSSDNKKAGNKQPFLEASAEKPLPPIHEAPSQENFQVTPEPIPSKHNLSTEAPSIQL